MRFTNDRSIPNKVSDKQLRVSIVIPSFQQARYIERTLVSILSQNYSNLEIIVIDGGSTDGTVDILTCYDRWITKWISEPDRGQSDALNKGFSIATGDVFGWMNSDDLYLPGVISQAVEIFNQDAAVKIVYGDYCNIDEKDEVLTYEYAFDFSLGHLIYEGFNFNAQGMFWKKEVHARFGLFDEELNYTMDYDFMIRLGKTEPSTAFHRVDDKCFGAFRRYEGQKTAIDTPWYTDERIFKEHQLIASKNQLNYKFTTIGKFFRAFYRLRRFYWYLARGGMKYTTGKLMIKSRRKSLQRGLGDKQAVKSKS